MTDNNVFTLNKPAQNDPKRPIQTGLGEVEVKVSKVRDRSGSGIKFNSSIVPPYLKRSKHIQEFLPWLYLRGISTGDFSESLKHLLGAKAMDCLAKDKGSLLSFYDYPAAKWQRLRGSKLLAEVVIGVKFIDGIKQTGDQKQDAA